MSFVGCIGTLMNGSGLEELLEAAFKGIRSMLNGKAWLKGAPGLMDGGSGTTAATDLRGDYCGISRRATKHDLLVMNGTTLGALLDHPTPDHPSLCAS